MNARRCTLAAALLGTAALTACQHLPGAPPVVVQCTAPTDASGGSRPGPALVGQRYGMEMTTLPLNSVQFGSTEASRALAVQSLHAARTPTDTVQVHARFVSCLDSAAVVRVRTSFLRADQAPAEAPSAWQAVYLEPRATALYSERSISRDAASYLIEVMK